MRNAVFDFISHSVICLINTKLSCNYENMRNDFAKSFLVR